MVVVVVVVGAEVVVVDEESTSLIDEVTVLRLRLTAEMTHMWTAIDSVTVMRISVMAEITTMPIAANRMESVTIIELITTSGHRSVVGDALSVVEEAIVIASHAILETDKIIQEILTNNVSTMIEIEAIMIAIVEVMGMLIVRDSGQVIITKVKTQMASAKMQIKARTLIIEK